MRPLACSLPSATKLKFYFERLCRAAKNSVQKQTEIMLKLMVFLAASILAFGANVSGVCEDDLVPLEAEAGKLPAVWNLGLMPHVFINSVHLRGVGTTSRDYNITGLDTVRTFLHLCPVDMTIYGNLTVDRLGITGNYSNNLDFINHGSQVFGHGAGFVNFTFSNLQLRNIVAPVRYSTGTQRLQLDVMQYEVHEDVLSPIVTGMEIDGEGAHKMSSSEFIQIDQTSSFPTAVEIMRAILNTKAQKGILHAAVKDMFRGVFSL